jgi:hypothetical protein
MKIYLATTAPGNETIRKRGMMDIPRRLLSYYHILTKTLQVDLVFKSIKKEKRRQN